MKVVFLFLNKHIYQLLANIYFIRLITIRNRINIVKIIKTKYSLMNNICELKFENMKIQLIYYIENVNRSVY